MIPKNKHAAEKPPRASNDHPYKTMRTKINPRLLTASIITCAALLVPMPARLSAETEITPFKTIRLLTLDEAQLISDAAVARAAKDKWDVAIVIVDAGGHLVSLRRMDGTQVGSIDIAIRKAVSAVEFKRPTKDLQDLIAKDGLTFVLSLPNVTAVEGGLPILHNGHVIGAIGISGATASQDGIIAAAGLENFR
jgi:glc operon protein GlcG